MMEPLCIPLSNGCAWNQLCQETPCLGTLFWSSDQLERSLGHVAITSILVSITVNDTHLILIWNNNSSPVTIADTTTEDQPNRC